MHYYHIDAFAEGEYLGNPAGVCVLKDEWLTDAQMQSIAFENNLAETAFVLNTGGEWHIRWFTPGTEVRLCGHATFASFFALINYEGYQQEDIRFLTRWNGTLRAVCKEGLITIDLPADRITETEFTEELDCFGIEPVEVYKGTDDYMFIYRNEDIIKGIKPDLKKIARLSADGIIITAKGDLCDFVSRFFAPGISIDEDPVTGSAHTLLAPYWSKVLSKPILDARQLSRRGGKLSCEVCGDRVLLTGKGRGHIIGEIILS